MRLIVHTYRVYRDGEEYRGCMEGCPHRDLSWFNEIFINPSKPGTVETGIQKELLFYLMFDPSKKRVKLQEGYHPPRLDGFVFFLD